MCFRFTQDSDIVYVGYVKNDWIHVNKYKHPSQFELGPLDDLGWKWGTLPKTINEDLKNKFGDGKFEWIDIIPEN